MALPNGTVVLSGGNMRKIRSPVNHQMAYPVTLQDGTKVLRTANGQMFRVTKL